jgi:branched-chain amino acid transport system permease protein
MTAYILTGLVSGSIYALAALGLVSTYVSSGVLNFAYGSFAYFVARFYYFLHVQHGWAILPAAIVSIGVFSPLAGLLLWALIFRRLTRAPTLVKVAATIGLSVAFPPLADLLFKVIPIYLVPGLAPEPVALYHVFGVTITLDQVIALSCLAAVLAIGGIVLRFTTAGLLVRAVVDSETMTSLTGVSPQPISAAVWTLSFLLAGLVGVLVAPTLGMSASNFTFLTATAFAAIVVAKLRHPGRAVLASLALGITTALVQEYAPPSSSLAQEVIPAVPFAFVFAFILVESRRVRQVRGEEEDSLGIRLARQDDRRHSGFTGSGLRVRLRHELGRGSAFLVAVGILALLTATLPSYWAGVIGEGCAFAVVFLSFTLLTGDGGFISLAQVTFAGFGAAATAQLATVWGLPPLLALAVAALTAVPAGLVVGVLTVRLGDLYVALITLTLGLLMDNLVFALHHFTQNGSGVGVARPGFASSAIGFALFALAVFGLVALFLVNVRRSSTGMGIAAARWSGTATRSLGLSTTAIRTLVVGVGGAIAALGGGLIAMFQLASLPGNFATPVGLVWLAVAVAIGIRSIGGALAAGLSFTVVPALVATYLPSSWTPLPTLLFGLAAIGIVQQPDGIVTDIGTLARSARRRLQPARRIPAASELR